ncbi:MAG: hypothetical protein H0W88_00655 [Parachlamydiaceae bacterium]|nr:hypothetical protein [Parachlamydiaceae bacterium]
MQYSAAAPLLGAGAGAAGAGIPQSHQYYSYTQQQSPQQQSVPQMGAYSGPQVTIDAGTFQQMVAAAAAGQQLVAQHQAAQHYAAQQQQPAQQRPKEIRLKNGSTYIGEVNKEGVPHGNGKLIYPASDPYKRLSYEGQFQNSFPDGQGTMRWASGEVHVGFFVNNATHGQGHRTAPGGRSWVGEFRNGKEWDVEYRVPWNGGYYTKKQGGKHDCCCVIQ